MNRIYKIIFATSFLFAFFSQAYAQEKPNEARGQFLYSTHCNVCHTAQIHWRQQKLATNWDSLLTQVRRWNDIGGLNWSEDEISDVAHYLNVTYYGYENTALGKNPDKILLKD